MKKLNFFGKKLPAWLLLAALVVVGAGAATGLVLKDQVDGTTTIAVSQAIRVQAPASAGDEDEFLGTVDDDGMSWAAHFEANNGDEVEFTMVVENWGANADITQCLLTLSIPDGMTINVEGSGVAGHNPVRISYNEWKFGVTAAGAADTAATMTLTVTIALEDALPTGFYTLEGSVVPLNV